MVRMGLSLAVFAVSACSIANPLFAVEGEGTGGSTGGEPTGGPDAAVCGDSKVDPGEDCDDGNAVDEDACLVGCVDARCGDGRLWAGRELCDDGNVQGGDACPASCRSPSCGDGVIDGEHGEACDDGPDNGEPGRCNGSCGGVDPFCGDGEVDGLETCDDGNQDPGDGCDACVSDECGDGEVDPGEDCDDGNDQQDDGCSDLCKFPGCGDGFKGDDEKCDDGDGDDTDECTSACVPATCGDGLTWAGVEQCDDGNDADDDACPGTCQKAVCGDGIVWAGVEACDDDSDGCVGCEKVGGQEACGDGVLDVEEDCDPEMAPFDELGGLCSDSCTLAGCFIFHNDAQKQAGSPVLAGNDWLTACADAPGETVAVVLLDEARHVVYAARGDRGAVDWMSSDLTMGQNKPMLEYSVKNHQRLVAMQHLVPDDGKADVLMLTSQVASPGLPACQGALGDGYGVALFPDINMVTSPRLLVLGVNGGVSGDPRPIAGFEPGAEISFKGGPMNICVGVAAFGGTFVLGVY